jgi:tripartite ATP-independent transporter DctP family solute receptor
VTGATGVAAFGIGLAAPFVAGSAAASPTVLKLALPTSQADPMSVSSATFAKLVEKNSKGALRIQLFNNGTLGTQSASITGMQTGMIDLTNQTTAWLESLVPQIQALDLPFAFANDAAAERVLDGPIGREVAADMAKKGVLVLCWATNGWRDMEFVSARVAKPSDMHNLKIRIQSGTVYVAMMRALGAVPVVIDFSEVYLALQQKVVDGLDIPAPTVLSAKLEEVLKSVSLTHHLYNPAPLMMSKIRYESLPADQQKAIRDSAAEVLPIWRENYKKFEKQALASLKAKGLAIETVDRAAFRAAMTPVYDEIRQKAGAPFVDRLLKEAA